MPAVSLQNFFFFVFVFLILSDSFTWLLSYCTCTTDYYYKGTYFVCATSESKKQLMEMVIVQDEKKSMRKWLGHVWYARKFQPRQLSNSMSTWKGSWVQFPQRDFILRLAIRTSNIGHIWKKSYAMIAWWIMRNNFLVLSIWDTMDQFECICWSLFSSTFRLEKIFIQLSKTYTSTRCSASSASDDEN
jgi:hypothetical protein